MNKSTLTITRFTRTMKIGILAVLIIFLCIAPTVAIAVLKEPTTPGWKYRGELNNSGLYNDGGYHPNGLELWNLSAINHPSVDDIFVSTPAIDNGIIYVADRGNENLFAIYASNGAIKWQNPLSGGWIYSSPVVANGTVYIGTGTEWDTPGVFYAFNASTGGNNAGTPHIPIWQKDESHGGISGGFYSSPTVYNGTVYVGRDDYNLSAWNAVTGAEVWRYQTASSVDSSPAVSNNTVYFSADDNVYAVNATTGVKVWDAASKSGWDGTFGSGTSSPAVANDVVYIGGEYAVYAFGATNGSQLSKFTDSDAYFDSAPAVANGLVYIGTQGNPSTETFYALDADDLSAPPLWVNITPDQTDMISSPAVANGIVYVTSEGSPGHLYAWNAANGAPVWDFTLPSSYGTESSPVVSNGVVYFGTWLDGLFAIGTESKGLGTGIGVVRSGQWILDYGMDGITDRRFNYGLPTDKPVVGDFNNDGTTDIGVVRSGQWILDYGIDGTVNSRFNYGLPSDTPVVGDFNNDGIMDSGVVRSGQWILDYGINGIVDRRFNYGLPTDKPIVGDFNNDGIMDIGVVRSGQWILDYGINGIVDRRFNYGLPTDTPHVGDFNNDWKADIGVYRSGQWILDYGIDGTVDRRFNYGLPTDIPIVGKWV
jgi:outer membrane protein assembly factor BamB/ribosomal protein L35AE/L33A